MPHGDNRYMETKFVFEIKNIQRPIGITILAKTKVIDMRKVAHTHITLY